MARRVLFGFAVVGAALFFAPHAANASPTVVNGPCDGTGAFQRGGFTKTAAESGVVEIPRADEVDWTGSITGPSGQPFGSVTIDSWGGTTDATSNSGTKHYDISSAVPANVEFSVKGSHNQGSFNCSGSVKLKIKGSSVNAFSIGSLVGTALTGAGLVVAGRARSVIA
jgi:hypothetical protein